MNHHRIDIRRPIVAIAGVLMIAAPLAGVLSSAQAQIAPDEVCEPAGQQLDEIEDLIDENDPGDDGSQLEKTLFSFLRNVHGNLTGAHETICPPDDPGTTTSSSTTTTTPPSTTTTIPAIEKALTASDDALVHEVGRLRYEPSAGNTDNNRGRAAVVLDTERGWGYRVYAGLTDPPDPRVHRFDIETLADGPDQSYDVLLGTPATGNNASTGTDLITAAGGGKLFVTDTSNRVHVINGEDLVREQSYAPPLLNGSAGALAGDTLDSVQSGRSPAMPRSSIQALAYLPPHGEVTQPKLLVYIAAPVVPATSAPGANFLAQWDVATGEEDWSARLSGCSTRAENTRRYAPTIAVSEPRSDPGARDVMLGCYTSNGRGEVWSIRLSPDGTGITEERQAAIVPSAYGFFPDPVGRRMGVYLNTGAGQFVVGVDMEREGVYGAAQLTPTTTGNTGIGIDPGSGRLYGFASSTSTGDGDRGGLLMVDGRRQPLPQRFAYPELNPIDQGGSDKIEVAPATSKRPARVFVPINASDDAMIRVYEDRRPVVGNTPLSEADRFTKDVEEEEGKTRVSTTAATSAYGVRVWLTGGLYHLLPPETVIHDTVLEQLVRPACEPHSRELVLAEVSPGGSGTVLSSSGINGAAVSARLDERTRQDLTRPAAACWPTEGFFSTYDALANSVNNILQAGLGPANDVYDEVKDTPVPIGSSDPDDDGPTLGELLGLEEIPARAVPAWPNQPDPTVDELWQDTVRDPTPFHPAACSQPGREQRRPLPEEDEDHGEDDFVVDVLGTPRNLGPAPGFTAFAACGEDGRSVVSHATATNSLGIADVLTFESAETTSRLVWQGEGGVSVVTEARVRGVDVLGTLRIGEVRTRAVTKAAGRPGTAGTSIVREWCGVVGLGSGNDQGACQNVDDPDFQERLRQFNENVLVRRGLELRATPIDPELRQGTPGGALASIQKDRFLVAGESFLNNDERSNVAAFELIEVTDTGANRSRHVYQLAGVEGSTSYNISTIPQFDFTPFGLPTFDGTGALPPSASEVLAGTADRRTLQRVVGAQPAGNTIAGTPPAVGGLLEALGGGLRWLLRNPLEALKFMALLATAWALPLHLHEKRRMLATATMFGRN